MVRKVLSIMVASTLVGACWFANAVEVGEPAPEFSLPELEGRNMIDLASHRGKVIYLDFWSSWCLPCRISLPLLSALRDELSREDFEVLAIDVDRIPEEGRAFLRRYPVSFPVASDSAGQAAESYSLLGMPTSFIIDREGIVRHVHRGFKENDIKEIRERLEELIGESQPTL